MGEDMRHGEQQHRRGGSLCPHDGCQLHDLIRLAAQQPHGCGGVQGETRDGDLHQPHETNVHGPALAQDQPPGQRVHHVEHHPQQQDGQQPIACMAEVLPQHIPAHIERQEHHHDGGEANDEEYIFDFCSHDFRCKFTNKIGSSHILAQNIRPFSTNSPTFAAKK